MKLRKYQIEALTGIKEQFKSAQSTLLVMATGTGKTQVFASMAKEYLEYGRVIILAHREELIFQAYNRLTQICGVEPDLEMGDYHTNQNSHRKSPLVVSTVQTQMAGMAGEGRMSKFKPEDFTLLIADECFPAGTLIDGIPVEDIKLGDIIRSYNHKKEKIEAKKVIRLFKKRTDKICKITLSNKKIIVCTPNHPIFSLQGYIPADKLEKNSMVYSTIEQKGKNYVQKTMQNLRENSNKKKQSLSQCSLRLCRMQKQKQFFDNGENQQEICLCSNEKKQSNAQARNQRESEYHYAGDGMEADITRGQRQTYTDTSTITCLFAGMANGSPNSDKDKRMRLPIMLQNRYSQRIVKNSNRSRRWESQELKNKNCRQKKVQFLNKCRVESVEIFQRGSDEQFSELCPDSFVYNLEVADNNNYFANDILVHNCHHAISKSWKKVINYYRQNPNLRVLGVTATPDRADEEALGQMFETVAFEYGIKDGIGDGYLVPIEQRSVWVEGLDYSSIRTTAGDLNGGDLARVLEFEENIHRIASPTVELCGDRKTLVFAASLVQAERLTEIFNRHKDNCARWVHGGTPKDERRQVLKDYTDSKFQYLVNVGVFTEGFDEPAIEVVVMARPTKSRSLYSQMVGRSTRPLPNLVEHLDSSEQRTAAIAKSAKPATEIIDFVGNAGRHKLITTADILGGNYPDEGDEVEGVTLDTVVERAKKNMLLNNDACDVETELQKAEREIHNEKMKLIAEAERKRLIVKARYESTKVNAFDKLDIVPWRQPAYAKVEPATEKQLAFIEKRGFDTTGLTKFHARQVIDHIINTPTVKMKGILKRFGYDADKYNMKQASEIIDAIAKNNWRRPA